MSLFPRQQYSVLPSTTPDASLSISTLGTASLGPAHLTAHAHVVPGPLLKGIDSPKESLNALVTRMSVVSMPHPPDYDTVYRMLREREKDLEVAAKIGQAILQRNELLEVDLSSTVEAKLHSEQQVAQLRYDLAQKEELLRLYARDAKEREGEAGVEGGNPEWVHVLMEECRELRESNLQLRQEADYLHHETAEVEQKERDLVHQCLVQFTEAKQRLSDLREEAEQRSEEMFMLQSKLKDLNAHYEEQLVKNQQLLDDSELLKEQLVDAQESHSQLTNEVSEWQEKYGECSAMLKVAQEEVATLKETSLQRLTVGGNGTSDQLPTIVEHESIVQEIEEVLRKEIIAASTLPERPRSPNHYARQRTMVVMETVKAATLAMSRKQERLTAEAERVRQQQEAGATQPGDGTTPRSKNPLGVSTGIGMAAFSPISASSPHEARSQVAARGVSTGTGVMSPLSPSPKESHFPRKPPSPIFSDAGSTISLPDEFMRYRNQPYIAPEKLQIVKPLEGSVTLLKWKLLASPQLGGATTFFSDASRPGVHMKGWKAAGIVDKKQRTSAGTRNSHLGVDTYSDLRQKSMSTTDLSSLNTTYPQGPLRRKVSKRERLICTKASQLNITVGGEAGLGMNDITEMLPRPEQSEERSSHDTKHVSSSHKSRESRTAKQQDRTKNQQDRTKNQQDRTKNQQDRTKNQQDRTKNQQDRTKNQQDRTVEQQQEKSSLFKQVGNILGSGLSRFGLLGSKEEEKDKEKEESDSPESKQSTDVGLAGVL